MSDQPLDEDEPKPRKSKKRRPFWQELPILIAVALVLTFLIQTFLARVFVIPSASMEQTLHGCPGCYGDRVLVDKLVYTFGEPEVGEVVVFKRPATWNRPEFTSSRSDKVVVSWLESIGGLFGLAAPDEDDVVKRIAAVGGQTIKCCDEQNRVLVDGKPLDEPYIFWDTSIGDPKQAQFGPITVPRGMLFVMGDNRNNSGDSRSQGGGGGNGLVPVDNVIGKVRAIILPPSRWQGVGDHNSQALSAPAWQTGIPAGLGIAAAWPTLWLGRRVRTLVRPR
ncbi:signal peptidase I [Actinokineospora xionganensis]|uniref:Signal peptidase I n=1 Tax=Actinokineospora xionganensis TaxID=2684470 RepID=A0ABR7LDC0_9PSEU|nr:signal peptidase I [Actinokineospora xionganensis]MBC6450719.1 signal peptidase I [Actinokineospora xionganensis]